MLVLDGESTFATDVVRGLGLAGIRSHILSTDALAPSRGSRHVRSCAVSPHGDDEEFVERAAAAVARTHPDVIVAADSPAIGRVVRLSASLSALAPHAPVPSRAAFGAAIDKLAFAAFTEKHHVAHPRTLPCTALGAEALADLAGFPIVAKPARGAFGQGIVRFDDIRSLRTFVRARPAGAPPYLLQQFIAGDDIDCSVLCHHGEVVAYTTQRALAPHGAFAAPDAIEFVEDRRVVRLVRTLMSALRWHGVAHVDLRYDRRREHLYVIEVNPRFWGSLQGSIRAGVNFPLLAVQLALGHPVDQPAFVPCRFVSGSGAIKMWRQALLGPARSRTAAAKPIGYSETMLPVVQSDPGPAFFELARVVRRWVNRRRGV